MWLTLACSKINTKGVTEVAQVSAHMLDQKTLRTMFRQFLQSVTDFVCCESNNVIRIKVSVTVNSDKLAAYSYGDISHRATFVSQSIRVIMNPSCIHMFLIYIFILKSL